MSPWPVTLSATNPTFISVRLQLPPAEGNVVKVVFDTTAAANYYALSACSLTFTDVNWNQYQNVSIMSVLSFAPAATVTVRTLGMLCVFVNVRPLG